MAEAAEIEITPEMIEAGAYELMASEPAELFLGGAETLAADVFRAMLQARGRAQVSE